MPRLITGHLLLSASRKPRRGGSQGLLHISARFSEHNRVLPAVVIGNYTVKIHGNGAPRAIQSETFSLKPHGRLSEIESNRRTFRLPDMRLAGVPYVLDFTVLRSFGELSSCPWVARILSTFPHTLSLFSLVCLPQINPPYRAI